MVTVYFMLSMTETYALSLWENTQVAVTEAVKTPACILRHVMSSRPSSRWDKVYDFSKRCIHVKVVINKMKIRSQAVTWWECCRFTLGELCANPKVPRYLFTVRYLILMHAWNKDIGLRIIYLSPLVWNESIAGNQHNLGKFGRVTVHGCQWRGL